MLESDKSQAELYHWQFLATWHADIDLSVNDVPLGDVLDYDTLAVMGRAYLSSGESNANPDPGTS